MKYPRQTGGFTLIELLIVVAIIAILAAIAVPNFLEAQTRSKVSRAKADLRSMALGLEAYYVDNNSYPYAENIGSAVWLPPGGKPRAAGGTGPGGITSPIAYMTSIPEDPFKHQFNDTFGNQTVGVGPLYYERAGFVYENGTKLNNRAVAVPADAIGTSRLDGIGADTPVNDPNATPARWVIFSAGPDLGIHLLDANKNELSRSRYNLNNRYDPTNGTISAGNVIRFPGGGNVP